jgi:hypothetical protein
VTNVLNENPRHMMRLDVLVWRRRHVITIGRYPPELPLASGAERLILAASR